MNTETNLTVRDNCRGCHSENIVLSVSVAEVPIISPNMGFKEKQHEQYFVPLDNYMCQECGLNQLTHIINPSFVYDNYLYRTSISTGLAKHFEGLATELISELRLKTDTLIVEIGSNDGTLLNYFKNQGFEVVGIDPARDISEEANKKGIRTYQSFFDETIASKIQKEHKKPLVIMANNVLANIDNLDAFFDAIKLLLDEKGTFVFETQYALDLFEKRLVDVIYHEHLTVFSVKPLELMLKRFKLELYDAKRIDTKGGSIRFWVQHENGSRKKSQRIHQLREQEVKYGLYDLRTHSEFCSFIEQTKSHINKEIDKTLSEGYEVAAWGTSVGCLTLLHAFDIAHKIDVLFDDTPFKARLTGPSYNIKIKAGSDIKLQPPKLLIFLAWRYAEQIIKKHKLSQYEDMSLLVPLERPKEA